MQRSRSKKIRRSRNKKIRRRRRSRGTGRRRRRRREIQEEEIIRRSSCKIGDPGIVITDVDDTIKCSGGFKQGYVGGVDMCDRSKGEKKGEFYPGILEFEIALSKGTNDREKANDRIVPASARPHVLKTVLGIKEKDKITDAFRERRSYMYDGGEGEDPEGSSRKEDGPVNSDAAMYGEVGDQKPWSRKWNMGVEKIMDILSYRSTLRGENVRGKRNNLPLTGCISFVGDNGQGDELLARALVPLPGDPFFTLQYPYFTKNFVRLLENKDKRRIEELKENVKKIRDRVKAVWIHDAEENCGARWSFLRRFTCFPSKFRIPEDRREMRRLRWNNFPKDEEVGTGFKIWKNEIGQLFVQFSSAKEVAEIAAKYGFISRTAEVKILARLPEPRILIKNSKEDV